MSNIKLIFPVYINQRVVFDFVATMQDGIATVTRATVTENEERGTKAELGGSFGLGAALSNFFRIDAKAGKNISEGASVQSEASTERYQTPTSLLARLIATLRETGQLSEFTSFENLAVSQLIEFEAILSQNPMIETLDSAMQGWELVLGIQNKQTTPPVKGQHKSAPSKIDPAVETGITAARNLLADLKKGQTTDIISSELTGGVRAVVTLEREYLSDPSMANLVEGRFKVLGKVIRKIESPEDGISLLRNSTIGKLNESFMAPLITAVQSLNQFVSAPAAAEVMVKGPAFHILPVAIYT